MSVTEPPSLFILCMFQTFVHDEACADDESLVPRVKMAVNERVNARGWPRNRAASNAGKYMTGPQGAQVDRTVRL